jgi:hypothetical protein
VADGDGTEEYDRHDIELRDVAAAGERYNPSDDRPCLVVSYNCIDRANATYTAGRHVSARLPVSCLVLFEDGTVDVSELAPTEREWVRYESARFGGNEIDFAGVE